jgi:uncharacterized protein YcgL (UPF0745 family)
MIELNMLEDFHKNRNRNMPCPCGSGKKAKKCVCNISKKAKKNVKDIVYGDVNEAVMADAENFAKDYSDEDIATMQDMMKDKFAQEEIQKVKERVENEV